MFPPFPLLNKSFRELRITQEGEVILKPVGGHFNQGPLSHHSVPPGLTVTTSICLGQQVVPSARLEYQAAGFSKRSLDSRRPLEDPQQTFFA